MIDGLANTEMDYNEAENSQETTTMLVRKAHTNGACIRLMSLSLDEYPQSRPPVQEDDDDAGT